MKINRQRHIKGQSSIDKGFEGENVYFWDENFLLHRTTTNKKYEEDEKYDFLSNTEKNKKNLYDMRK